MLTRDLFAVANLPVQFPSVNMHLRIINIIAIMQYNTHSSRVTKFVYGRSSAPDHAGELTTFPRLRIRLEMETPFPIVHPSTPSVSRSGHLTFQPVR